jgi:two-component system, NarL family, sensor histidine kinase EvgS
VKNRIDGLFSASHHRLHRFLFLLIISFCAGLALAQGTTAPTAPQAAVGKVVKVAIVQSFPPLYQPAQSGGYEGFAFDLLNEVSALTGLIFEPELFSSFAEVLRVVQTEPNVQRVFVSASSKLESSGQFLLGSPFLRTPNVLIGRRPATAVSGQESAALEVGSKRIAAMISEADLVREQFPLAVQVIRPTSRDALTALLAGDADYFVSPLVVAQNLIESGTAGDLMVLLQLSVPPMGVRFGANAQQTSVMTKMDQAIQSLDSRVLSVMSGRWMPARQMLSTGFQGSLTAEEMRIVSALRPLRIGFDRSFTPYTFVGPNKAPQGIAFDYIEEFSKRIGLKVGSVHGGTWSEVLNMASRGEVDLLVAAGINAERKDFLKFVGPYSVTPTAIISAPSRPLTNLADANDDKIAILRDHFLLARLKRQYPRLRFIELGTSEETLSAVLTGGAIAALGNIDVMAQTIAVRAPGALMVSAVLPDGDSALYFALRPEAAQLEPLLLKVLAGFTEAEHAQIRKRWTRADVRVGLDWKQILSYVVPGLLALFAVIGTLIYSNIKLKKANIQQRLAELEARQASEAKTRFIGILGHEVRTPLAALVSGTQLLSTAPLGLKEANLVRALNSGATGVIQTLNNLLEWLRGTDGARQPKLQLQPSAVGEIVSSAVETFRSLAEQNSVSLRVSIDPQLAPSLVADGVKIRQVIVNLLSNAIRHAGPAEVHVRVKAEAPVGDKQTLRFTVADNGSGIASERLSRLFKPFEAPEKEFGRSIGLALSQEYLHAMGSELRATSGVGQGTRLSFDLTLPISIGLSNQTDEHVAANRGTVLLVDDDRLNGAIYAQILEREGFAVDVCDDALLAFDLWRTRRHAIVLLDASMPGLSGVELAKQLRSSGAGLGTMVFGLTADNSEQVKTNFRVAGANDTFVKPLNVKDFVQAIAQAGTAT